MRLRDAYVICLVVFGCLPGPVWELDAREVLLGGHEARSTGEQ
jgi:hypothetical protein